MNSLNNPIHQEFHNYFIYSDSPIDQIESIGEYLPGLQENFPKNIEIFSRQYFSPKLSIKNNLRIVSDLYGINSKSFLNDHSIADIYEEFKFLRRESVPTHFYNQIMLNLYLYINKNYFINMNISKTIQEMNDVNKKKVMSYFRENKLFYFASFYQEKIINEGIFKYFLVLYDKNKHEIFENQDDFKSYLQN